MDVPVHTGGPCLLSRFLELAPEVLFGLVLGHSQGKGILHVVEVIDRSQFWYPCNGRTSGNVREALKLVWNINGMTSYTGIIIRTQHTCLPKGLDNKILPGTVNLSIKAALVTT